MATIEQQPVIDAEKLMAFVFRAVEEVGATLNAALVVMGDRLGLYRALAGAGPTSPARARRAHRRERALRARVAERPGGRRLRRVRPGSGRYTLPPEQAVALTDEDSPAYLPGFFQIALGDVHDSPRIIEAARTGAGVGWHEHDHDVHEGCERFFRPGYHAQPRRRAGCPRSTAWSTKLERGARVADVGCGHGASTILMAQAFPALDVRRLRLPRGVDRDGAGAGAAGRRRRPRRASRSRTADGLPGRRATTS